MLKLGIMRNSFCKIIFNQINDFSCIDSPIQSFNIVMSISLIILSFLEQIRPLHLIFLYPDYISIHSFFFGSKFFKKKNAFNYTVLN